jgi:DNA-binding response OmpR family regulator
VRVLLIEDSARLRRSLGEGLRRSGYAVDSAGDGEEGLWYATENAYDVILLDLMLPGLDGLSLLRTLRERGVRTHVLILSARDQVESRVEGLNLGADDYLVKPFSFDELLARIGALLRRSYQEKSPKVRLGSLEVDMNARRATVEGNPVPLSAAEFNLLQLLLLRRGEVLSRQDLGEHLYPFESEISSNVIDVFVCSLRKKLGRSGAGSLIRTRRGHGYLIEDPPA